MNDALLELADTVWQTPATIPPTNKCMDRKYHVPNKGMDFLFSHPQPNSLVVEAVNQQDKQPQFKSTPPDKDWKRLDLQGCKVYTSATLQFHTANDTALLSNYDHDSYTKLTDFVQEVPEEKSEQFRAIVNEGQLIARTALQASLNMADTAACKTATAIVMRRVSWLHSSVIPKELQYKAEDLPSDRDKLFSAKADEVFHSMKDSRARDIHALQQET